MANRHRNPQRNPSHNTPAQPPPWKRPHPAVADIRALPLVELLEAPLRTDADYNRLLDAWAKADPEEKDFLDIKLRFAHLIVDDEKRCALLRAVDHLKSIRTGMALEVQESQRTNDLLEGGALPVDDASGIDDEGGEYMEGSEDHDEGIEPEAELHAYESDTAPIGGPEDDLSQAEADAAFAALDAQGGGGVEGTAQRRASPPQAAARGRSRSRGRGSKPASRASGPQAPAQGSNGTAQGVQPDAVLDEDGQPVA